MSVISKNPFDLLGDDGDSSPAPVKATPAPAANTGATKKAPNAQEGTVQRNVPGSNNNRARSNNNRGGRGGNRGGAVGGRDDGPRNTGPDPASGTTEGLEGPGGFEGERVNPPKKAHHGPDRHTRTANDQPRISGGHTSRRGGVRGGRAPNFGGERRQYERRSGGLPDSQKKVDLGWGANEGTAELTAEVEGEKDAQVEEAQPGTPAPEDGEETPVVAATEAAAEADAEPEEVQKSFDQFLAERAQSALGEGLGKKEGRTVNTDSLEGKAFVREAMDEFFSGGKDTKTAKAKAPKKEKIYIEVDGNFASPPGGNSRGGRGGERGRGSGEGRGRGGRGRGGPRGAPRGGAARGGRAPQGLDASDEKAFPSLGA